MTLICGIDDAGRGPVLGPMVLAGVLIEENQSNMLKDMGCKDSKQLSPKKREELFTEILKISLKHKIVMSTPQEIDDCLRDPATNLNWLEAAHCVDIIDNLKPDIVYIDCPSPNLLAFRSWIRDRIKNKEITLITEHKADINYPVCSAASILAKVTRDKEIDNLKAALGVDCGSGYLADPITQTFLQKYWKTHHHIFRKSWESYQRIEKKQEQQYLTSFK